MKSQLSTLIPKSLPLGILSISLGILLFSPKGSLAQTGMDIIYGQIHEIDSLLAIGKLNTMHEHAEAIEKATQDLDKDSTLNDVKKKRVQGYGKNLRTLADKMHDAADAKKLEETKSEFAKLKAQADLLDKQFSKSHKPQSQKKGK